MWLPLRGTFEHILFRYFFKVEVKLAERNGMREAVLALVLQSQLLFFIFFPLLLYFNLLYTIDFIYCFFV